MFRSKWPYLFFCFFIFNPTCLFPGLFSDNIVFVSPNKYCLIKNLRPGDSIASLDNTFDQQTHCYSGVSGIRLNKNFLNTAILIILKSDKGMLSSIVVESDQKFCVPINHNEQNLESSTSVLWIDAENLEKGLHLKGYDDANFTVKNIKHVNFENNRDFYEISLNPHHTFYLVDSNGNRILTHNIAGLIVLGLGCIIGGVIGGGAIAYKTHKNNGTISIKKVAKGALVGVIIGGVTAIGTYYGITLVAEYLPIVTEKISTFLITRSEKIKMIVEQANKHSEVRYFIGVTISGVVCAALKLGEKTIDYFDENERRENEDIDFSGIDFEEKDNEEKDNMEVIINELFLDENGNPIRDRNGKIARIVIARQRSV